MGNMSATALFYILNKMRFMIHVEKEIEYGCWERR